MNLKNNMKKFLLIWMYLQSFYSFARLVENSWEMTEYVWNFGIAQVADIGLYPDPVKYFKNRDVILKKEIIYQKNHQNIIWMNPDNIKKYYPFLKRLSNPSILIISDGDNSFPYECGLDQNQIEILINHPNILHIFAQNLNYNHPKVSPIPVGIDFHSMAYKQGFSAWGENASPLQQEGKLKELIRTFEPAPLRKKRIFVDFHLLDNMRYRNFKRYLEKGEDRSQIFHKLLKTGLIDYLDKPISRIELWKKKGEYAFTISPQGNGLDCHRTWEDLALGCIVIVKTSSLDCLYERLPVVIVNDWDEVTKENLEKWLLGFENTNLFKLKNQFWIEKIIEKSKKADI